MSVSIMRIVHSNLTSVFSICNSLSYVSRAANWHLLLSQTKGAQEKKGTRGEEKRRGEVC